MLGPLSGLYREIILLSMCIQTPRNLAHEAKIVNPPLCFSPLQSVSFQMLVSMVQHFQQVFGVRCLEGVYPTMTLLSQQIENYRNVQNRLKNLLNLGMYVIRIGT